MKSLFSFPKSARLLKQKEFRDVARFGKQQAGRFLFVQYVLAPPSNSSKLGMTVSRKFGKSHVRNRFKRILREAFRHIQPEIKTPFYVNVRPRTEAAHASMENLECELREVFKLTLPVKAGEQIEQVV